MPLEEVTPQLRRNAKAVNFGIVYGISAFGLAKIPAFPARKRPSIERYFETYPDVNKRFLDGLVKRAGNTAKSRLMYGRVRPIPELKSGNFMQRSFGERVAMNSRFRNCSRHYQDCDDPRRSTPAPRRTAFPHCPPAHDELLIETWKEELEQVQPILATEMKRQRSAGGAGNRYEDGKFVV